MSLLLPLHAGERGSLYEIRSNERPASDFPIKRFIASTPETRAICNDPFVVGVDYTEKLRVAAATILPMLLNHLPATLLENHVAVLNILRGGLNFRLREALADAFGWNTHASAFISSQRARSSENPEDWHITESAYQKVQLPQKATIIFADVVATGTSLEYALKQILNIVQKDNAEIESLLFFTIGGMRSEEILLAVDSLCRQRFENYRGATVVYFEGRFAVAAPETQLSIKYTGTDLLRTRSLLAPEFIDSQYQDPAYPIERCTIYDAGSRAYWIPEYVEDVADYWEKTLELAKGGMHYTALLNERFPELQAALFKPVDLANLCLRQLQLARELQPSSVAKSTSEELQNSGKGHKPLPHPV